MSATVTVQWGNTDDKLSQFQWSRFCAGMADLAASDDNTHFFGYSVPDALWQNGCWVFNIEPPDIERLRYKLEELARTFGQDSIAMAVATHGTRMIKGYANVDR